MFVASAADVFAGQIKRRLTHHAHVLRSHTMAHYCIVETVYITAVLSDGYIYSRCEAGIYVYRELNEATNVTMVRGYLVI